MVKSSDFGDISVYDLVGKRLAQMEKTPVEFEPYTGPIYDNEGNLQIKEGEKANKDHLLSIMYFADNVASRLPKTN